MKNLFTLVLVTLAFTANAQTKSSQHSAQLTPATPESVGMSSERLDRIDAMCKAAIKDGDLPGMVALVARNGKIVFHEAYGKADNTSGKSMEKEAIFRIASQTKAITSTAVMMLWEEGKFRLDDPISKYIPEFKNPQVLKSFRYADTSYSTVAAKQEITIRQLLTHTSGIGYADIDGDEQMRLIYKKADIVAAFSDQNITIEENVKKLAKLPLHHNPGEKYTYSLGLDVLGYFVELMSGMPFDEYLRKHIFDPLGMEDTYFYLPKSKAHRLVAVQKKEEGKWAQLPDAFYNIDYPIEGAMAYFSGGGGLSSTARDYATFLQMYLNGGELNGKRLLSRTTVQSMMGNQTGDLFGGRDMYLGLAFRVLTAVGQDKGGIGSEGTFEWGGYFNTQYFANPKEKIIGVIMKQTQGPINDNSGWRFKQLVGQAVDD